MAILRLSFVADVTVKVTEQKKIESWNDYPLDKPKIVVEKERGEKIEKKRKEKSAR